MTLDGFTVLYTVAFLMPGFILHTTLSIFVPQKAERPQIVLLRYFALSCLNYTVWSWLIYLIFRGQLFAASPVWTAVAWVVMILVSPLALGIFLGCISQREVTRRVLQKFGFHPSHPIPTAWDYKFSKIPDRRWVLVTLKDGNTVAGLFGSKSFASSEAGERDLYIQEVFKVNDKVSWQRAPRNDGILIHGDQIKHIEFWSDVKEQSHAREERTQTGTRGLST